MMHYLDRMYFLIQEKKWERYMLILAFSMGIIAISQLAVGVQVQEELAEEMIRVHVTAAGNTPQEQEVKLEVRDAISQRLEELLSGTYNKSQMRLRIRENMVSLQQIAKNISGESVTITLDIEQFPTRYTNGQMIPAGEYETLRIVLGEGEGHNWWCMLFPEYGETTWEEEQDDGIKLRFWLVEWWQKWTSKWFEK